MNEGGRKKIFILIIFFFVISLVNAGFVSAVDAALSGEAGKCLGCHAERGIVKKFENNESLEAFVDAEKFRGSVHKFMTCSKCHTDFSQDKHPKRRFRSKKQYKLWSSRICRRCHPDEQISKKPIHVSLLSEEREGRAPVCTDCHGSHSVMPIAGGEIFASEKQYCLSCHGYNLSMVFQNGEALSLRISMPVLEKSVHNKLGCSDCHYGFSSEEHPQRNFRARRDYSIASADSCRRCHFDKHAKTLESIHYAMLSKGNLKAPVCTDCHGSHSIVHTGKERTIIARRCRKCHPEIYEIYAKSVHGQALFDEHNQDVPVCTDCHRAHDIRNPLTLEYHEMIPEMCGNCHASTRIMGKYGLSTDVVKTYLSDFHGVTLKFYIKQRETLDKPARPIAVCTDCHGIHNIRSTIGTDAREVKANLVKRCQKCHEDATGNFPDTWLSHYEPSLAKAPLVFIVNLLYKIFLPFMVIGLALQILLHIWRYSINR